MGVALCTALLNLIDRFLVLGIYGDEVFAVYSSNVSIPSSIFNMLSVGVLRGVYPAVLRAWRESGRETARGLLSAGVRLYMLIAFPAAFGLTAVALPFTRIFFDSGYDAGAPAIGLMSFTMVLMGLTEYANKGFELNRIHALSYSTARCNCH
ncbi:MAG: oligosaccharide flippase family protein [Butyricicoccus sp.]